MIPTMNRRIDRKFFVGDALDIAPALLGMELVIPKNGLRESFIITETEAYRGEEDLACHARKGRTPRTEMMYQTGGVLYVYLVYGMHWMMNIVTGIQGSPQAVLLRGVNDIEGPGRLTRSLGIDKSYNGEDLDSSHRIWLERTNFNPPYKATPRIGIDYAGPVWKDKPWRFITDGRNLSGNYTTFSEPL